MTSHVETDRRFPRDFRIPGTRDLRADIQHNILSVPARICVYVAHVAEWKTYNLHGLGRFSGAGAVLLMHISCIRHLATAG